MDLYEDVLNELTRKPLPDDRITEGACFSCSTFIKFRVQKWINEEVDEVNHKLVMVVTGGFTIPTICPHCGALNILDQKGDCHSVQGYDPRRVVGVTGNDVPRLGGDVDITTLVTSEHWADIKFIMNTPNRMPLSRIEWIDYFKVDPAIQYAATLLRVSGLGHSII